MSTAPAASPPGAVLPLYFGASTRPLYGVYHPPATPARRVGAVLCPAGPHEYRQTHWAVRMLATLLAANGIPVLRFDYYGTGDSGGTDSDADLDGWVHDARVAADELSDMTGVRRVAFVGLRLGASVAARAAAATSMTRALTSDVVLWDPVVNGRDYLDQLRAADDWHRGEHVYPERATRLDGELLGFVISPAMRAALETLDLTGGAADRSLEGGDPASRGPVSRALAVRVGDRPDCDEVVARLEAAGRICETTQVDDPTFARPEDWGVSTLLPHRGAAAVAAFLARGAG